MHIVGTRDAVCSAAGIGQGAPRALDFAALRVERLQKARAAKMRLAAFIVPLLHFRAPLESAQGRWAFQASRSYMLVCVWVRVCVCACLRYMCVVWC